MQNSSYKRLGRRKRNQLNYKVLVADHGMETVRDIWGRPTGEERKLKILHVVNMFTGKIEEYKLTDSYNRIHETRNNPDYKDNEHYNKMSDYGIMDEYVEFSLKGNGSVNANIINDNLMANREAIEKYIQDEVSLRLEMALEKAGLKEEAEEAKYLKTEVDFSGEHI